MSLASQTIHPTHTPQEDSYPLEYSCHCRVQEWAFCLTTIPSTACSRLGGETYGRKEEGGEVPEGYGQRGRGSECLANRVFYISEWE